MASGTPTTSRLDRQKAPTALRSFFDPTKGERRATLVADPLADLLIPFDPAPTLEKVRGTFQLYAAADPKIAAAQDLMDERIGTLAEADQEAVAAVFWATYRRQLCAGARPARLRDWLGNGDRVLWAVQVALDTYLRPSALTDFAETVRQLENSD